MIKLIAENIKLASTNKRLMPSKNGYWFMHPDYRKSKAELIAKFRENGYSKAIDVEKKRICENENIGIKIIIQSYKDIDNPIKLICDVLEEMQYIKNDRYINKMLLIKKPIKRGRPESIYIIIDTLYNNNGDN